MPKSDRRYVGKLCTKHPEEQGLRYKVDSRCVACARDRRRAKYPLEKFKSPEWKAAQRKRMLAWARKKYRKDEAFRRKHIEKAKRRMKARREDPTKRPTIAANKIAWKRRRRGDPEYQQREAAYMAERHKRRWAEDPEYRKRMRKWTALYLRNRSEAQPPWQPDAEIDAIYERAAASGLTVDHIVPLRHPNVCGLHVPWNLQPLPAKENCAKGNRFDG